MIAMCRLIIADYDIWYDTWYTDDDAEILWLLLKIQI